MKYTRRIMECWLLRRLKKCYSEKTGKNLQWIDSRQIERKQKIAWIQNEKYTFYTVRRLVYYIYRTFVKNEIKYHQSSLKKHAHTLVRTIFVRFILDQIVERVATSHRHKYWIVLEYRNTSTIWNLRRRANKLWCANFFGYADVKIRVKMCAHSHKMQTIKFG